MALAEEMARMTYLSDFEKSERKQKRQRGKELAAQGLEAWQISERLGVSKSLSEKWGQRWGKHDDE